MNNLLKEYVEKAKELDQILSILTKDYCADQCEYLFGCCSFDINNGFPWYLIADNSGFSQFQQVTADSNGCTNKRSKEIEPDVYLCKYYSESGCTTLKSPLCIKRLCPDLVNLINDTYSSGESFTSRLDTIYDQNLNELTIKTIQQAINAGKEIINKSH